MLRGIVSLRIEQFIRETASKRQIALDELMLRWSTMKSLPEFMNAESSTVLQLLDAHGLFFFVQEAESQYNIQYQFGDKSICPTEDG